MCNVHDHLKDFPIALAERQSAIKRRHGRRVEHRTKRWAYHLRANLVREAHEILHPQAGVVVDHITHNSPGRGCREVGVVVEDVRPTLGSHRRERRDKRRHPSQTRTIVAGIGRAATITERRSSRGSAIMMESPTGASERGPNWATSKPLRDRSWSATRDVTLTDSP